MDHRNRELEDYRRARDADPEDRAARALYHAAAARSLARKGLGILCDREAWQRADRSEHDAAIGLAWEGLGADWEPRELTRYACGGQTFHIAGFLHRPTDIAFNLIPGGQFLMGTEDLEGELAFCEQFDLRCGREEFEDEAPARRVQIAPILLARAQLSRREWTRVTGRRRRAGPEPVTGASFDQARAWLAEAGEGLRLPSEAEWEYACRAGTSSRFFWGDEMDDSYCWYNANSADRLHAPEEHADRANAFGLIDMLGNLQEWCADVCADPGWRVTRGGSWNDGPPECRAASRDACPRDLRERFVGLRVACSIPGVSKLPPLLEAAVTQ